MTELLIQVAQFDLHNKFLLETKFSFLGFLYYLLDVWRMDLFNVDATSFLDLICQKTQKNSKTIVKCQNYAARFFDVEQIE
jgi:hypothetical protein